MIAVSIPSQLQSYCAGASWVRAEGETIDQVLRHLDQSFPGIRFRVIDEQDRLRKHMRLFVGQESATDISRALQDGEELLIFGALSGG